MDGQHRRVGRCGRILMTIATLLTAAHAGAAVPALPLDAAHPEPIDTRVAERMREGGLVGVGAAIVVDGRIRWLKGYGFADRERAVPFTPDTVMNIGSISKTVTGVALMRAVQQGDLSLDADINAYLPFKVVNPSFPAAPITLRQLATHTSGITDRWEVYAGAYRYDGQAPEDLGLFLRHYFDPAGKYYDPQNFLASAPGTHREYSNIGAALAGYIVERAVGERLDAYTKRHIFAPLGMTSTTWHLADVPPGHHARLYIAQNSLVVPISPYELTTYPDGGVRTSVADLARFFAALLDGGQYRGARILSSASTREMLRFQYDAAHTPDNVDPKKKNSGIFWATKMDGRLVGHGGSDPGLKTEMLADPSLRVGVILFTNTSLGEDEMKSYAALLSDLRAYAERMDGERRDLSAR